MTGDGLIALYAWSRDKDGSWNAAYRSVVGRPRTEKSTAACLFALENASMAVSREYLAITDGLVVGVGGKENKASAGFAGDGLEATAAKTGDRALP